MSTYTYTDVALAARAMCAVGIVAWESADREWLNDNARAALDAVAPRIAARAKAEGLREFADFCDAASRDRKVKVLLRISLRAARDVATARADQLERP